MPLHYFKPDTLIATSCDYCGTQSKEPLARLYSNEKLICAACGMEHTPDREDFRKEVDETEAMVERVPSWATKALSWLRLE